MADGFDLHLDDERAAKLKAAADALGLTAADYAMTILDRALDETPLAAIDPDPAIDEALADQVERTGEVLPWSALRDRLRRFGGRDG